MTVKTPSIHPDMGMRLISCWTQPVVTVSKLTAVQCPQPAPTRLKSCGPSVVIPKTKLDTSRNTREACMHVINQELAQRLLLSPPSRAGLHRVGHEILRPAARAGKPSSPLALHLTPAPASCAPCLPTLSHLPNAKRHKGQNSPTACSAPPSIFITMRQANASWRGCRFLHPPFLRRGRGSPAVV
jgi:hypothetical protein